ncbi:multiple organellar RNA editing factor 8, chloroplastic/mitochondrial [Eucalyptus grandis]|uniref:multiple organellar RNA editing factor 8, chloroplastic/mitochondrial n=1 Tax=Eucalyptus grandis TaxID=71139 RepID=UPI00192F08AD|nr:multiple organellar RNA editing factor 8, chloroplastic/mitochondrial [Eucalyptus grandis]XP_010060676.2 multiple organellar RNA editing factor 8, chloroplastic/mitochondrial [Eucalyptus grandis]XP_039171693.1 multiple organellar RNA editing factor 8, chloroplastic/mitochondrial [Eucalyptus grandis]
MATQLFTRSLLLSSKPRQSLASLLSRSLSFSSAPAASAPRLSSLLRHGLRPLSAASAEFGRRAAAAAPSIRSFATRTTSSSLNDPNPNWSNRPPKETILLDGCDFEHWLVVMEKPEGDPTRDDIIDSYIKTLAQIVGSEEEARMKIYSVSTRHYFAFGALVSEELSYKLKELPRVRWVLPDSYLDVKNKDYGGEPFINGQAVPYDPKYHEEWVRNNARANERNRRNNDRPRNFDRSRNFDRRRENMQNRDFQARDMPNQGMQNPPPQGNMPPPNMGGGMPPPNMGGGMPPPNMGGGMPPPTNFGGMPPHNQGGMPPHNQGGMPPHNQGGMPPHNQGGMPPHNQGGMPPHNQGGMPPSNYGGMPPRNQGECRQTTWAGCLTRTWAECRTRTWGNATPEQHGRNAPPNGWNATARHGGCSECGRFFTDSRMVQYCASKRCWEYAKLSERELHS